jgi:hypothetical protein
LAHAIKDGARVLAQGGDRGVKVTHFGEDLAPLLGKKFECYGVVSHGLYLPFRLLVRGPVPDARPAWASPRCAVLKIYSKLSENHWLWLLEVTLHS